MFGQEPPADQPFLRAEYGLGPEQARAMRCHRVFRGVYVRPGVNVDAQVKAQAAWLAAGRDCVLSGYSAAALLGVKWLPDHAPAHITTSRVVRIRGVVAIRDRLDPGEVTGYGQIRLTNAARTAFDLGRRLPLDDAVAMLDAIYQATGVRPEWVRTVAGRHRAARGTRLLDKALDLSDPGAASPWETRTRLLLVHAGLPQPTSQHPARQARRDVERWNRLVAEGWVVVRVTRRPLEAGAGELVQQVRDALQARTRR